MENCLFDQRGGGECGSSRFPRCISPTSQTSITIDDIVYIIDSGRMKEVQYNPETQLSNLVEGWVSKAAGRQRRGRAGRTQPGICYKTYTRKQEKGMPDFSVPEILRVSLNNVCLSVKAARESEDVQVFSRTIDPMHWLTATLGIFGEGNRSSQGRRSLQLVEIPEGNRCHQRR